jgi:hypothetical protein
MSWRRRQPGQSFGAFVRNFRQRGSLSWKIERYAANMLLRIRRRSNCCGNDGEPGC